MMEIAISLAIIGVALVAIIGVLPLGMNTQQDNRQRTLIAQDAGEFIEAIRNGSMGLDDLTNYVYAISNSWVEFSPNGQFYLSGTNGYTYSAAEFASGYPALPNGNVPITNGMIIVGLLGTPEFMNASNGAPLDWGEVVNTNFDNYYFSNRVVAYVHSISGTAVDRPPQDNPIMQQNSFGYRLLCQNLCAPHWTPPVWQSVPYPTNAQVCLLNVLNGQTTYWQAPNGASGGDVPGVASDWQAVLQPQEMDQNSHQLRLTFMWPQLPNGSLGNGRQTFRTSVTGQILVTNYVVNFNYTGLLLYFYQSQLFVNTP